MEFSDIVKIDQGGVNQRILAREEKADFRRVEAASLKITMRLESPQAKRLFARYFSTLQLNTHFVSIIARTKLRHEDIELVETALREQMESVKAELNKAIDGAEALFISHGIKRCATYDTQPMEMDVGVISSIGRRYLEIFEKLDRLMPMLQTLEIHEVIPEREADIQRARGKRIVKQIAGMSRNFAGGIRRRMNSVDADEARSGSRPVAGLEHAETEPTLAAIATIGEEVGEVAPVRVQADANIDDSDNQTAVTDPQSDAPVAPVRNSRKRDQVATDSAGDESAVIASTGNP